MPNERFISGHSIGGTVLVERVESLVAEIDDPSTVDLVALGDFLALRK